ncbi:MAG: ornithine--oxo-acid transaminase [Armatimonadetes bacterium]|nr:ornithine--oxo-acid transaminase [Armatimonadota bacterium]
MALELSDAEAVQLTERYGTHNYKPLAVNVVRGDGAECWDGSGKRFIDCVGAYSAVAHGHLSERVIQAVHDQLERLSLASRAVYTSELALFLKGLAEYCDLDMVCPMNTGAEAVETCIKIARKWAYTVKGVPDDKAEIIVCEGNFHGRTTTIVGFSTEEGYRDHFGPFTPGFKIVPFGDLKAVKDAMGPNTAGVLIEPIQAEGGILIPPDGYLEGLRKLCTQNNSLVIWDEVQTGFSRTGKRFAWRWEDAKPDLMAVGKPLGGGVMPVSAAVGTQGVMEVLRPGDHGSTFGGNPLGCVVALSALAEMEVEGFSEMSIQKGERLMKGLASLNSPRIKELRGRGLLIGMEVQEDVDSAQLTHNLIAQGLLTKETRHRTFRFTPPIVIEDSLVDEVIERVGKALAAL